MSPLTIKAHHDAFVDMHYLYPHNWELVHIMIRIQKTLAQDTFLYTRNKVLYLNSAWHHGGHSYTSPFLTMKRIYYGNPGHDALIAANSLKQEYTTFMHSAYLFSQNKHYDWLQICCPFWDFESATNKERRKGEGGKFYNYNTKIIQRCFSVIFFRQNS